MSGRQGLRGDPWDSYFGGRTVDAAQEVEARRGRLSLRDLNQAVVTVRTGATEIAFCFSLLHIATNLTRDRTDYFQVFFVPTNIREAPNCLQKLT